jgi:uncharacterized protein YoxC
MGLFAKKQLNSEEYEKLSKRIIEMESDIQLLASKTNALQTNQNSLRGMVNRKLNPIGEEQEEQQEEGKDIKSMRYY